MRELLCCRAGAGKFLIEARAVACGADWSVTVCGGERYHIGAVALGQYEPERSSASVSTVTVYSHRDDIIAAHFAKAIAAARRCVVTVAVGIHVDGAGAAEIAALRANCADCLARLLQAMEDEA